MAVRITVIHTIINPVNDTSATISRHVPTRAGHTPVPFVWIDIGRTETGWGEASGAGGSHTRMLLQINNTSTRMLSNTA